MLQTTSNLPSIVDPAIRGLWDFTGLQISKQLDYTQMGVQEFFPNVPASKLNSISGFGAATLSIEGQTYGSVQRYEGYAKEIVLRKYTSSIQYTKETLYWLSKNDSAQMRTFKSMTNGAVQSMYNSIDTDFAKLFYLGFGTTFYTGGDSKALFASDHTVKKPGESAVSNLMLTNHRVLSSDAIVEAITQLDKMVDNNGVQLWPATNLTLVVSSAQEALANQILYSDYGPATANLGLNPASAKAAALRMRNIKVKRLKYLPLTSTYKNYWFLIDEDRMADMLVMAFAWKPQLDDETNYHNGTFFTEGSTIVGPNFNDFRWAVASKGDDTTI